MRNEQKLLPFCEFMFPATTGAPTRDALFHFFTKKRNLQKTMHSEIMGPKMRLWQCG